MTFNHTTPQEAMIRAEFEHELKELQDACDIMGLDKQKSKEFICNSLKKQLTSSRGKEYNTLVNEYLQKQNND